MATTLRQARRRPGKVAQAEGGRTRQSKTIIAQRSERQIANHTRAQGVLPVILPTNTLVPFVVQSTVLVLDACRGSLKRMDALLPASCQARVRPARYPPSTRHGTHCSRCSHPPWRAEPGIGGTASRSASTCSESRITAKLMRATFACPFGHTYSTCERGPGKSPPNVARGPNVMPLPWTQSRVPRRAHWPRLWAGTSAHRADTISPFRNPTASWGRGV